MHIDISIGDCHLRLLSSRAVYWPRQQTLFVADTHFGKAATFRRHGIPVPSGSTERTLATISGLLDTTKATHLVILGDMFHSRSSLPDVVCDAISEFFDRHASLRRTLVLGNHDAHVGRLPVDWKIDIVLPGTRMGSLALGHQPIDLPDGAELLLCGHLHPALQMQSSHDRLGKLPCFWLSNGCLVLPAIGQFTGTHAISVGPDDQAWVIVDDQLVPLPQTLR